MKVLKTKKQLREFSQMNFEIMEKGFKALEDYLKPFGEEGLGWESPIGGPPYDVVYGLRYNPDIEGKICIRGYNRGEPYSAIQVRTDRKRADKCHWRNVCDNHIDRGNIQMIVRMQQEDAEFELRYLEHPDLYKEDYL